MKSAMDEILKTLSCEAVGGAADRPAETRPVPDSPPADFGELYASYYKRIFSYVMRTVMNRQVAEDITSEAFCRALARFATFRPARGTFSSWIYRIATNTMRDHFRRQRPMISLSEDDPSLENLLACPPDQLAAARQREQLDAYRILHEEIRRLRPLYRIVIVLFYFEEKSIAEIAAILDAFVPTIRWRLHQARKSLARQLNRRDQS